MMTLAAVILAVGALVFTIAGRPGGARPEEARAKPEEERRAALEDGLRDLEFEFRLGKLSENDYRQTRQEMERELAALGEPVRREAPVAEESALSCPHCGARFPTPLKFCGECGRPMRRSPA